MSAENPRYVVETGTDGSFLLVDHGQDRDRRIAIERFTDASEGRHVVFPGGGHRPASQVL